MAGSLIVCFSVTKTIDFRPHSRYITILAPLKEVARRHAGSSGEDGARGWICSPFPGGLGHQPAGIMTGMRGARCNRNGAGGGNPPLTGAALREAWSEAEPLGCVSPLDKSRGGTPEGERALQGARRSASCGGYGTASLRRSASFFFLWRIFWRMANGE